MKCIYFSLISLIFPLFCFAQESEEMASSPADRFFVADGSRIRITREDISIVPPEGWEVQMDVAGMTALFRMPKSGDDRLPRTIEVRAFSDPVYIDSATADQIALELEERYSGSDSRISDYRLRSHIPVEMRDGSKAWLFYYGFSINAVELMHAHLLTSSESRHYVVTYTDVAENFVNETAKQEDFLDIAWKSMTSMQLPSKAPVRMATARLLGFGLAAVTLILAVWFFFRRKASDKKYAEFSDRKLSSVDEASMSYYGDEDEDFEGLEVVVQTEYDIEGSDEKVSEGIDFEDSVDDMAKLDDFESSKSMKNIG